MSTFVVDLSDAFDANVLKKRHTGLRDFEWTS